MGERLSERKAVGSKEPATPALFSLVEYEIMDHHTTTSLTGLDKLDNNGIIILWGSDQEQGRFTEEMRVSSGTLS